MTMQSTLLATPALLTMARSLAPCGEKAREVGPPGGGKAADAVTESAAEMKEAGGEAAEAAKETASTAGTRVKKGHEAAKQSAGEIAHDFSQSVAAGADMAQRTPGRVKAPQTTCHAALLCDACVFR